MSTQASTSRRYALDWLRVLAILMIFIFHSGRFFDLGDWHVKNAHTYFGVEVWSSFLASWGMPFIFAISGASTFYSLGKRGRGQFVKDRTLRLLVPLVVGIFSHCALQIYLERITHGQFRGSFWDFLPHYFDGFFGFGGNFAWMGMHLWYLEMLFVFSIIFLPLLWWLRRGSGMRALSQLGAWLARPAAIYLLALPLILVVSGLDPTTLVGMRSWGAWSIVAHSIFFLYGFVLASHDALAANVQRMRWFSLAAGVLLFITLGIFAVRAGTFDFTTAREPLFFALFGLHAWCWILALWGFGGRYLNFGRPALWYANEAVLPFYIMHQTVLLGVGYFVVQWAIPDLLKWAVITVISLLIIGVVYIVLVRRSNLLRILFGMKPLPRVSQPVNTAQFVKHEA
jgi:peptidoglycan/LPS O-acetylase OafA/YrhL